MSNPASDSYQIVPRDQHPISRKQISKHALKVLYRLKEAGFQAHLVGGGVRDLLLGREPKDFDVATDARPEDVRKLFRNCRLIGRRFRLAHVYFGREIIEVATFRGATDPENSSDRRWENGMIVRDNCYGTRAEDALRRDFTINALYYNIADFSVIDYANGLEDLRAGRLRLIGDDPERRYREDPVRMLRAVRFAAKLGFQIDPSCEQPLQTLAPLLQQVPAARLFDEVLKLFQTGFALQAFEKLRHYGLFGVLFPATEACLAREEQGFPIVFVSKGLENTDQRVQAGQSVTPAFLFAILLWEPVRQRFGALLQAEEGAPEKAMLAAASQVIAAQQSRVSIPKRFYLTTREIWFLQTHLERARKRRSRRLLNHPRFRAAYDFLLLRAAAGEVDPQVAEYWTALQAEAAPSPVPGRRSRFRRGRKRPAQPVAQEQHGER